MFEAQFEQLKRENKTIQAFPQTLEIYKAKAKQKKQEYLQRIKQIFRQFVAKCEKEIDKIIQKKMLKLNYNYLNLQEHYDSYWDLNQEEEQLVVNQYLVKPFQKFPFSGNKNEKIFKQQYNLIEKATVLIEQTLVDSFNQDEIPDYDKNYQFLQNIKNKGIGEQSLVRFNVQQSEISLQHFQDLIPLQKNIKSVKMIQNYMVLVGDNSFIQIWDLQYKICVKKLELDTLVPVTTIGNFKNDDENVLCLALGFGDQNPEIRVYRTDNWQIYACTRSHTRSVTKIITARFWLLSGSVDGNLCIYNTDPFKNIHSCPHISSIQDLIQKNDLVYVLLKCSSICEYELFYSDHNLVFNFRRNLSSGHISMIRYTEVGSNFAGVACHIYGLSQIEITRKFRVQETNIINVPQMIADFVVVESKKNSEYFAICAFQNSSAIRIYSLKKGDVVFEVESDYMGEVGVAGYLPKVQIAYVNGQYWVLIVNQSEFEMANTIKMYKLAL